MVLLADCYVIANPERMYMYARQLGHKDIAAKGFILTLPNDRYDGYNTYPVTPFMPTAEEGA